MSRRMKMFAQILAEKMNFPLTEIFGTKKMSQKSAGNVL